MKKIRNCLLFIIGGISCSVFSVYATTMILSKNVIYDNTSSKISSENVQDAIDEIYDEINNSSIDVKYIDMEYKTYSGQAVPCISTYDLTSIDNYKDLVLFENLFPVPLSFKVNNTGIHNYTWSYNNSNGILTLTIDNSLNYDGIMTFSKIRILYF